MHRYVHVCLHAHVHSLILLTYYSLSPAAMMMMMTRFQLKLAVTCTPRDADARLNAMEGELQRLKSSGTGMQPAAMQAAVVQADVEVAADAAEMEQKKVNLRLNRLPEAVKSQTDAEVMVPELMEALGVDVEATKITYIKPSYKAALTTSSTSSSVKTGAVLVSVGSVQAKLRVLMARKRLKDSDSFASMGVEEDLIKRQQDAKNQAWPAFVAAKKAGRKATWRAEKLFIDDSLHTGNPAQPITSSAHNHTTAAPSAAPSYSQHWE